MPHNHQGRHWRSAEELGMEVRRVDFDPRLPRKPPTTRNEQPIERRAEIMPTAMGPSDRDVIYYQPEPRPEPVEGMGGPPGLPPIRVHHNHNHVTRHDDRERNFFLFLVTVIMGAVGGLGGLSIAAGFGWPWWPAAGLGAALTALPALAVVLRVASLDPERERHVTERRRDQLQAQLQQERTRLKNEREHRRIDIEAQTAADEAKLARERERTEQSQARANAERSRADRARIVEQAQRHSQPQSTNNQLVNYVPEEPLPEDEPLADEPPADVVRTRMLEALAELYDPNAERIERGGLVANGYKLPWTKRGGLTQAERRRALDILHQIEITGAPLFTYQDQKKRWSLNIKRYPTLESAIEALDRTRTRT